MCAFSPGAHGDFDRDAAGYSPDRVDALVWALSELFVEPMPAGGMYESYRRRAANGDDPVGRVDPGERRG